MKVPTTTLREKINRNNLYVFFIIIIRRYAVDALGRMNRIETLFRFGAIGNVNVVHNYVAFFFGFRVFELFRLTALRTVAAWCG